MDAQKGKMAASAEQISILLGVTFTSYDICFYFVLKDFKYIRRELAVF